MKIDFSDLELRAAEMEKRKITQQQERECLQIEKLNKEWQKAKSLLKRFKNLGFGISPHNVDDILKSLREAGFEPKLLSAKVRWIRGKAQAFVADNKWRRDSITHYINNAVSLEDPLIFNEEILQVFERLFEAGIPISWSLMVWHTFHYGYYSGRVAKLVLEVSDNIIVELMEVDNEPAAKRAVKG